MPIRPEKTAIVLLSGGLDSTTALYKALKCGYEVWPVSFSYGQKAEYQERAASFATIRDLQRAGARVANVLRIRLDGDNLFDGSSILRNGPPLGASVGFVGTANAPQRNTLMIAAAFAIAESNKLASVWVGCTQQSSYGLPYPDSSIRFLRRLASVLNQGSAAAAQSPKGAIRLVAPYARKTKVDVVLDAVRLGVPIKNTYSCYLGDKKPCGECGACLDRQTAFSLAKVLDTAI